LDPDSMPAILPVATRPSWPTGYQRQALAL
jgi:hypothetical protein